MPEFPLVEEYKKPTGIRPEDIRLLRDWLGTQPHLPGEFITDLDLVLTYHCCGRSSSVSKQLLDLNFTLKTLLTGLFKERIFDERMKKTIIGLLLTVLPERTKEGYAVFYTYFLDPDPKVFTLIDACRVGLMSLELQQYLDGSWPGLVIVFDLEKMALGHLARLDISTVQQFLYYLQEGLLASLKSLHFINAPPFMDKLMMILRPFLSKKLMDVLHIHQVGSKTLEPFFPMEKLPKGMAGGAGNSLTLDQLRDELIERLSKNDEYFTRDNKKRVVEAKRPGKPKTISDIFGSVDGSFKQLEID